MDKRKIGMPPPAKLQKLDLNGPVPSGQGTLHGGVKQLMVCPYDESHRVGFGHFALHLNSCRQKAIENGREELVVCKYNASHHMKKSVYKDHLTICDDYRQHLSFESAQNFELPPGMAPRKEFIDITKWPCYGNTSQNITGADEPD